MAEAKFVFGMVLVGMGLVLEAQKQEKNAVNTDDSTDPAIEEKVLFTTRAVAPILLPMIDELGGLDADIDLGVIGN